MSDPSENEILNVTKERSGCRLISAWTTMTLIVGFFLLPLGLVLGFFIGPPTMPVFGGIALALAVVVGLLLALYYKNQQAGSSPDEGE